MQFISEASFLSQILLKMNISISYQVKERYGPNLDKLHSGHVIGVMVDEDNSLHLFVNGVDQGALKLLIEHHETSKHFAC